MTRVNIYGRRSTRVGIEEGKTGYGRFSEVETPKQRLSCMRASSAARWTILHQDFTDLLQEDTWMISHRPSEDLLSDLQSLFNNNSLPLSEPLSHLGPIPRNHIGQSLSKFRIRKRLFKCLLNHFLVEWLLGQDE